TITEVNGVTLGAPISTNIAGVFSGGGSYNLGSGTQIASIWSGGATIDLAAILAANNISGIVTRANVILDNTLAVTSQAGTSAFIKKKELNGVTIIVPTPGAAALLGLGGLMATRRRR
ncbi:MAG: hypothetical protein MUE97_02400, partial [Phycisphaerales bacterium]|nr:hypothetical protein [Phycisphaerales bacterium]